MDPYTGLKRGGGGSNMIARGRGGRGGVMTSTPNIGGNSSQKKCKALYDFDAENPDELNLKTGDIITVTEELGEWWKGTLNGVEGIFPANYVEVITTPVIIIFFLFIHLKKFSSHHNKYHYPQQEVE